MASSSITDFKIKEHILANESLSNVFNAINVLESVIDWSQHPYVIMSEDLSKKFILNNKFGDYYITGVHNLTKLFSFTNRKYWKDRDYLLISFSKNNSIKMIKKSYYRGTTMYDHELTPEEFDFSNLDVNLKKYILFILKWTFAGVIPPLSETYSFTEVEFDASKNVPIDPYKGTEIYEKLSDLRKKINQTSAPLTKISDAALSIEFFITNKEENGIDTNPVGLKNCKRIDTFHGWSEEKKLGWLKPGDIVIPFGSNPIPTIVTEKNISRLDSGVRIAVEEKYRTRMAATLKSPVFREINGVKLSESILDLDYFGNLYVITPVDGVFWDDSILESLEGKLSLEQTAELQTKLRDESKDQDIYSLILKSLNRDVNKCKLEGLSRMFTSYYNEFNSCTEARAYLSSTVMMGSILELVLIDWINDIYGCSRWEDNLFNDKVYLKDYDPDYKIDHKKKFNSENLENLRKKQFLGDYVNQVASHMPLSEGKIFENNCFKISKARNKLHPRVFLNEPFAKKDFDVALKAFECAVGKRVSFVKKNA